MGKCMSKWHYSAMMCADDSGVNGEEALALYSAKKALLTEGYSFPSSRIILPTFWALFPEQKNEVSWNFLLRHSAPITYLSTPTLSIGSMLVQY